MEITGKIIEVLPAKSGVSQAGKPWMVQTYVVHTEEIRPKDLPIEFFGEDKIKEYALEINDRVSIVIDITSRKYKDNWFVSLRGTSAVKLPTIEKPTPKVDPAVKATPTMFDDPAPQETTDDSLPF